MDLFNNAALCPRTLCVYRPGVPLSKQFCVFVYRGRMPCTGPKSCFNCGRREPVKE